MSADVITLRPAEGAEFSNNILIGLRTGYNLLRGHGNIFLGNYAGEDVTEANNLLCVMAGGKELRLNMTENEATVLRTFLEHVLRAVGVATPPVVRMSEAQLDERDRFVAFRRERGLADLSTNFIEQLVDEVRRLQTELALQTLETRG